MNRRRAGVGRRRAVATAVLTIGAMLTAPTAVSAVGPAPGAAKPYFDSRVGDSRSGEVSAGERSARAELRSRLGAQAVVQVDPLSGTARTVQRLDGALTRPAAGDRSAVAMDWVRANRTALGLTDADLDGLALSDRTVGAATGITHLRYRQSFRGIPAFDNDLRVNLDRGGRILGVTGSPVSGLSVPSVVPDVGAVAAMRALQRDVGVERADRRHLRPGGRPPRHALRGRRLRPPGPVRRGGRDAAGVAPDLPGDVGRLLRRRGRRRDRRDSLPPEPHEVRRGAVGVPELPRRGDEPAAEGHQPTRRRP